MKDPYEILGITPNATDEEVKAAYRNLAKKYHPDNYTDSPLGDLAEQKMNEINEAYDAITEQRRSGRSSHDTGNGYSDQHNETDSADSQFYNVRMHIKNGKIFDADNILEQIPQNQRNAEWYFLKGTVFYKRGWSDQAYSYFQRATEMNPGNREYAQAYNRLNMQRNYPTGGYNTPGGGMNQCTCCDVCNALICANCCCNCLGGGC